ncbi:hypothetical protein GYA37_00010 [candidate division WWE3 bacterium]|uniref:Uncharacterized protein n=1 Tax=candidate division WWE3 bacterium TaxID=2053526 RepID=A0A7X9HS24_UNCKA|nr:hypothetical protein [candidate division WWE3 bacterium]
MAGRPGAVENSPYRKEIEEMLKEGKPDTDIAGWLKDKGKPISRVTINKYKNEKFNIPVEARKKYNEKKSKERLDGASNGMVSDIEKIDKFIEMVDPEILKEALPKDQATAVNRFLQTKYKILGVIDDKHSVEVNVNNNSFDPNKQKKILEDEGSNE